MTQNFEQLNVTRPDVVRKIHEDYIAAGAQVVETNTFGANTFCSTGMGWATRSVPTTSRARGWHGRGRRGPPLGGRLDRPPRARWPPSGTAASFGRRRRLSGGRPPRWRRAAAMSSSSRPCRTSSRWRSRFAARAPPAIFPSCAWSPSPRRGKSYRRRGAGRGGAPAGGDGGRGGGGELQRWAAADAGGDPPHGRGD